MFVTCSSIPQLEAQLIQIGKVLDMLSKGHMLVLQYLLMFLKRVEKQQEFNLMNASNIAIVFAPNLLRSQDNDLTITIEDTPFANELMTLFIKHYDKLFKNREIIVEKALEQQKIQEEELRKNNQQQNSSPNLNKKEINNVNNNQNINHNQNNNQDNNVNNENNIIHNNHENNGNSIPTKEKKHNKFENAKKSASHARDHAKSKVTEFKKLVVKKKDSVDHFAKKKMNKNKTKVENNVENENLIIQKSESTPELRDIQNQNDSEMKIDNNNKYSSIKHLKNTFKEEKENEKKQNYINEEEQAQNHYSSLKDIKNKITIEDNNSNHSSPSNSFINKSPKNNNSNAINYKSPSSPSNSFVNKSQSSNSFLIQDQKNKQPNAFVNKKRTAMKMENSFVQNLNENDVQNLIDSSPQKEKVNACKNFEPNSFKPKICRNCQVIKDMH